MNRYPVWWDKKITIYNRYEDAVTNLVTWKRHVIDNCFWKQTGSKVAIGQTIIETDDIICRIPKQDNYLESYVYYALPNDEMGKHFTLNGGDIIIIGEVEDEINEYSKGHRSSELIAKYKKLQGCMTIKAVANNTGAGRVDEHYYVKGE